MIKFLKLSVLGVMTFGLLVMSLAGCTKPADDVTPLTPSEEPPEEQVLTGVVPYANDVVMVSYDADVFSLMETDERVVFKTEMDHTRIDVVEIDAKAFVMDFTDKMLEGVPSTELHELLFWEAVAPHYKLSPDATELPEYLVNGMGTENLDKPVVSCFARIEVEAFGEFPALDFQVKMAGSDEKGCLMTTVYEHTMDQEMLDQLQGLEASMVFTVSPKLEDDSEGTDLEVSAKDEWDVSDETPDQTAPTEENNEEYEEDAP